MPGPALLHDHRGDPGVVGAGVEQGRQGVGELLAGGVVEVGLEHDDRLALPPVAADRPDRPDDDLGAVRKVVELAGCRPRTRCRRSPSPAGGRTRWQARRGSRLRSAWSARRRRRARRSGRPRSSRTTAGAGFGSSPWAVRTMPGARWRPGDASTSSIPRTSSAGAVPTTSTMASCPPTSWKWTCAGGPPVQPAFDLGQRPRRRPGRGAPTRAGAGPPRPARRCGRGCARRRRRRPSTTARVQAMPPRSTGSVRGPTAETGTAQELAAPRRRRRRRR